MTQEIPSFDLGATVVRREDQMLLVMTYLPVEVIFERGLDPITILGHYATPIENPEDNAETERVMSNHEEFVQNPQFMEHFHRLVSVTVPQIPEFVEGARRQSTRYFYLLDARTPDPQGDVPSEDIIGVFDLEQGLVPEAYEPVPVYRLVGKNGWFSVDWLEEPLMRAYFSGTA